MASIPLVRGSDGNLYVPGEFRDAAGTPVAGLRLLDGDELAEVRRTLQVPMTFLTAGITARDDKLIVELRRRTEDFRGAVEVLGVAVAPFDEYLRGKVRDACKTLGIHAEQGEGVGSHEGIVAALLDPEVR